MNVATNPSELYQKLLDIGWELQKVQFKNGLFVAKAESEATGQDIERTGKSPELAVAAVYQFAQRANQIRRFAALKKLGAWDTDWLDQKEEIAKAYSQMPPFDEKAVPAWKALAAESKVQADAIRQQITVEVVDDPEPYATAAEMCEDIHKNRHFKVSRANSEHPVWTVEDNICFRIVHDVIGHGQSGGDFSWRGENLACFTGEMLVRTYDGYRPISEVKVGDYVLSSNGQFNRVSHIMERDYDGTLYEILTSASITPIRATAEHPFYTLIGKHGPQRKRPCTPGWCNRSDGSPRTAERLHELGWVSAEDLAVGGWLVAGSPVETVDRATVAIPESIVRRSNAQAQSQIAGKTTDFELTADFLWMVGLYLAEGSSSTNMISFALHREERTLQDRLVQFFKSHGYGVAVRTRDDSPNRADVTVHSVVLSEWFPLWLGRGSHNKAIPADLINLPLTKLGHVLQGIFDGDGIKRTNQLKQTSPQLALQVAEIAIRTGGRPTTWSETNAGKKVAYTVDEVLPVERQRRGTNKKSTWRIFDRLLYRIRSIESYAYTGKVYNLTVENDPTYVVQNTVVHNCGIHFALVSPLAREALFVDCIAQTAYRSYYRGFGPQKIGFLSQFLHPVQEKNGEHVWVPHGGLPTLQPSPNGNQGKQMLDQAAGMNGIFNSPGDWVSPQAYSQPMQAPPSPAFEMQPAVMQGFKSSKNVSPDRPYDPNAFWTPVQQMPPSEDPTNDYIGIADTVQNAAKVDTQWQHEDEPTQKRAIMNAFRVALLSPRKHLKWNAAHYQALMHADPQTKSIDLWNMLEEAREKHNQKLGYPEGSHLAYRKQLEYLADQLRQDDQWLSAADALREAKKLIFEKTKEFETQLGEDPKLEGTSELKRYNMARRMVTDWMREHYTPTRGWLPGQMAFAATTWEPHEGEEVVIRESGRMGLVTRTWTSPQRGPIVAVQIPGQRDVLEFRPDQLEPYTGLWPDTLPWGDAEQNYYRTAADQLFKLDDGWHQVNGDDTGFAANDSKYGAFMGTHLDAIEQVGKHIDQIRDAALRDLDDGGKGFIFRNAVMNMNLPGVNPKVASFAWLLLAPMTSELGIIDTHILRGLRRDETQNTVRDYYKHERMQRAAKDATGYSHMPLGLYHWGLWDAIRNPGEHSDHSPLRVLDPLPWDSPDAKWDMASSARSGPWVGPMQFENARGHMERAGRDFDQEFRGQPIGMVPLAKHPGMAVPGDQSAYIIPAF